MSLGQTFLLGMLVVSTSPLSARHVRPLRIEISPTVAFAPANVIIRAVIEPHVDNRAFEVTVESTDFYRSSERQLDGDRTASTTTFEFRGLPAGSYYVKATLFGRAGGPRASVRRQVEIAP